MKEQFDELTNLCSNTRRLYQTSASTNNLVGAKRVITHDLKYIIHIFYTMSYDEIMEKISEYYELYCDKQIDLECNNEMLGIAALIRLFNNSPMSLRENLKLCTNPNAINIITKLDSFNAYNSLYQINEYIEDIEACLRYFKGLYIECEKRKTEVLWDAVIKGIKLFLIFLKCEAEKSSKILVNLIQNNAINIVERASLQEGSALIESCNVLLEAGGLNNSFAVIQQFINGFLQKIVRASKSLNIIPGGNTQKVTEWNKKLGNSMNDKIKFATTTSKDNTQNNSTQQNDEDQNQNNQDNLFTIDYYDKSCQLCININNILNNSFKQVPRLYSTNNIQELSEHIEDLTKIDESINRTSVLQKLQVKDDPNVSIDTLLTNVVSSDAVMESLYKSNMTNNQLIDHYNRTYNLLGKLDNINKRVTNYNNKNGESIEKFLKMFNDAKNKNDLAKANAQKAEQAKNPQANKPTPGVKPKNTNDEDVNFSKIDIANNSGVQPQSEATDINGQPAPDYNELQKKIKAFMDTSNNIITVETHLLQAYSTIVYSTIKDIESYFDAYNTNANNDTQSTDTNNNVNTQQQQANINNQRNQKFNAKDNITAPKQK